MRLGGGPASALRWRRVRVASGRWDTGRQRGDRRDTGSGDGAEHQRHAKPPWHARGHLVAEQTLRSTRRLVLRVPNAGDGSVSVLDLEKRSVVGTVKVGDAPSAATVDSDAHTVYVTNTGSASVSVIDSRKRAVNDTVQVGDGP
jgi:YVTN family beta-propeller protein